MTFTAPNAQALGYGGTPPAPTQPAVTPAPGAAATLPASVDLSANAVPAGNQGSANSCVSWAIGYGLMGYLHKKAGLPDTLFAPNYVYSQTNRGRDRTPFESLNSPAEDVFGVLTTQGIDTKAHYVPQGDTDIQTVPTAAQRANAANYKLAGYERLFGGTVSGDGVIALKNALASGYPVVIHMYVRDGFGSVSSANPLFNDTTATRYNDHAVLALGYNDDGLLIQNSWGSGWGNAGFARLGWNVVQADVYDGFVATGLGTSPQAIISTVGAKSTASTATITGTADLNGAASAVVRVDYGQSPILGSSATTTITGPGSAGFTKTLTGLGAYSSYYYKVTVTTAGGSVTSGVRQFAMPATPVVESTQAVQRGDTASNVATFVKTFGQVGTATINYGTTTAYGSTMTEAIPDSGVSSYGFPFELTGLSPGTTYHYKVTLTTDYGTTVTTDKVLTTPAPPVIEAVNPLSTGDTTHRVNIDVRTYGRSGTATIDYGITTAYGSSKSESVSDDGANTGTYGFELTGLTPGTVYNYRVTLTTSKGTAITTNKQFVTSAPPVILATSGITLSSTSEYVTADVKTFGKTGTLKLDYGTTTAYGQTSTRTFTPTGTGTYYAAFELTGLIPGQTYQYKATLTTSRGTAVTTNRTFTAGD